MELRANGADRYKSWLALEIEQVGRDVAGAVEPEQMMQVVFCDGGVRDPRVEMMFHVSNVNG